MSFEIRRMGADDETSVLAARRLFDCEPSIEATRRFLAEPTHHLLVAYDETSKPVGFVSGVEMTHPDKGTEMFLYELGVDESARRQGIGRALVEGLVVLAKERGCYDMWTATEIDNAAARATYTGAGAQTGPPQLILEWDFAAPLQPPGA